MGCLPCATDGPGDSNLKIYAIIFLAIACATSGCSWLTPGTAPDESVQSTVISTDQAVQTLLVGRDLSPIEGAWKHEENAFELVISRNNFDIASDYEFVGVITRTDQASWNNGDVKLLLRSTESPRVFEGILITSNHSRKEMTFIIERQNVIQANYLSNDGNTNYVRIRRMGSRLTAAR